MANEKQPKNCVGHVRSPSNNCPTSEGTVNNAIPVAISATAAKINTLFIAPSSFCLRAGD
jgi:hypothetical protein